MGETMSSIENNVIYICQEHKIYSLQEAQALIPYLQAVTKRHETEVARLIDRQQKLVKMKASDQLINDLQTQINNHMVQWGTKIRKLGALPLPSGAVGIDGGGYYWSWRYNETKIEYYHMLSEDSSYRRHLSVRPSNDTQGA